MARRTQQLSRSAVAIGAGFSLVAAVLLWTTAPVGVAGLLLDRELAIESGSQVPASSVRVGDRVIAVDGQPVRTGAEMAGVLARSTRGEADVTIEQRGRTRTVTLSRIRFESDPPPDLLTAARIVRVDDRTVHGTMPVSELSFFLEQAEPTPIEVEYELQRTQVSGPLPLRRRSHSPLVLGWVGLGIVGTLGVGLLGARRLTQRPQPVPLAAVGVGALALAGLTARLVSAGSTPSALPWSIAGFCVWRALVAVSRSGERGEAATLVPMSPAALYAAGAAFVSITSVGADSVGVWLGRLDQYSSVGAALGLGYLVSWARSAGEGVGAQRSAAWLFVALGVALGLVATLSGHATLGESGGWALLISGAGAWALDLQSFTRGFEPSARSYATDEGGLADTLAALRAEAGDELDIFVLAGVDQEFVCVRNAPDGSDRLLGQKASEPMASFGAMLALEGGMFPRHARMNGGELVEDDPFGDVGDRLGVRAAVPIGTSGSRPGVAAFCVAAADSRDVGLDLGGFVDEVTRHDTPRLFNEAVAMAAESVLQSARRAARATRESGSVPTAGSATAAGAAEANAPERAGPAQARPSELDVRWMAHMETELRREYPVRDAETLNDREWLALSFLRESVRPALIVGEPGVGKEFVARAVHEAMWGDTRRFAVVDCAEYPASIVEIELFGDEDAPGLVAAVGDGTLLLKSASAMGSARLEEVVARLQNAPVRLVFAERYQGSEAGVPRRIPAPIRRAAGDRNIHMSPLRDRPEDVVRYARYFLHRAAMRYEVMVTAIDAEAEAWLRKQHLPGNLHELRALVTAAALSEKGESLRLASLLRLRAAPPGAVDASAAEDSAEPLSAEEEQEKVAILEALDAEDGNRTRAAEVLGMTRGSLLRRLKKYGID